MFLQTSTIVQNTTTQKQVFSLWDILFSGGIIGNTIMIAIFLLGILALYVFFRKIFFHQKIVSRKS
jgi:biopolymer transport protein ExbB